MYLIPIAHTHATHSNFISYVLFISAKKIKKIWGIGKRETNRIYEAKDRFSSRLEKLLKFTRVLAHETRNTIETNTAHKVPYAINGYRNGRRKKKFHIQRRVGSPRRSKPLYERDSISRENIVNARA